MVPGRPHERPGDGASRWMTVLDRIRLTGSTCENALPLRIPQRQGSSVLGDFFALTGDLVEPERQWSAYAFSETEILCFPGVLGINPARLQAIFLVALQGMWSTRGVAACLEVALGPEDAGGAVAVRG